MKTTARRLNTSLILALIMVAGVPVAAVADDVPNPKPQAPAEVQNGVDNLLGLMKWGGIAAVVAGFMMAGTLLAIGKKTGHGGRDGTDMLWYVAGGAIVIGTSSSLAGFFF